MASIATHQIEAETSYEKCLDITCSPCMPSCLMHPGCCDQLANSVSKSVYDVANILLSCVFCLGGDGDDDNS